MVSKRQKQILKAIIDLYVDTAEPVGSKALADYMRLGLSSATLRNEMAALLERGYLEQPHTSAGRIPTHKGYRLYVNELMHAYSLTREDTSAVQQALQAQHQSLHPSHSQSPPELDRMLSEISRSLSALTRYTAITVSARLNGMMEIRRIDIVVCDDVTFVFVVVLGQSGVVRNKLYRMTYPVSAGHANALAALLNQALFGTRPGEVTPLQIAHLETAAGEGTEELLAAAFAFLKELSLEIHEQDIRLKGEGNLLDYPEYRDVGKARELLDFLGGNEATEWLPLPTTSPLVIRIGNENLPKPLQEASLIVARCPLSGGSTGYVGIVGPTRMNYPRLAARLSFFANGLAHLFQEVIDEDDQDRFENTPPSAREKQGEEPK